jgi:hypothetical protein
MFLLILLWDLELALMTSRVSASYDATSNNATVSPNLSWSRFLEEI